MPVVYVCRVCMSCMYVPHVPRWRGQICPPVARLLPELKANLGVEKN